MQIQPKPLQPWYNVFKLGEYGISPEEFSFIQSRTAPSIAEYERVERGDTDEEFHSDVHRLLHPHKPEVRNAECISILNSPSFREFMSSATGYSDFNLDRIQSHISHEGDYIGPHTDRNETHGYTFSLIFLLRKAKQGGIFYLFLDDEFCEIELEEGDFLLFDSGMAHHVSKIEKGKRQSLCAFMLGKIGIHHECREFVTVVKDLRCHN